MPPHQQLAQDLAARYVYTSGSSSSQGMQGWVIAIIIIAIAIFIFIVVAGCGTSRARERRRVQAAAQMKPVDYGPVNAGGAPAYSAGNYHNGNTYPSVYAGQAPCVDAPPPAYTPSATTTTTAPSDSGAAGGNSGGHSGGHSGGVS